MPENFVIRDFTDSDLPKFADHWRESIRGWPPGFESGGDFSPEAIRDTFLKSKYVGFWIGWLDDEIVGFLTYYKRNEDNDATYVATFNVHPDFHGKGYGRRLLKHSIDHAIAHNVKRTDLHTWAANEKAFPLYKKCGFFWRPRINYTQMYNFLPVVLNNPLVQEFLDGVSWYEALRPNTEIKQDDTLYHGCAYHLYRFEVGGRFLETLVDPSTSGLVGIKTGDFEIRCDIPGLTHVAGLPQELKWTIASTKKNTDIMEISSGENDFSLNIDEEFELYAEKIITRKITPPNNLQPEKINWYGKPIEFNVKFNDLEFTMKPGIRVVRPFDYSTTPLPIYLNPGREKTFFLNIRSNIQGDARFTPEFKTTGHIDFVEVPESASFDVGNENSFGLPLKLKAIPDSGSATIEMAGTLNLNGIESSIHPLKINAAVVPDNMPVEISYIDNSRTFITNGLVTVEVSKKGAHAQFRYADLDSLLVQTDSGSIGEPYTFEFESTEFDFNIEQRDNTLTVSCKAASVDFPGIELERKIILGTGYRADIVTTIHNNSGKAFNGRHKLGFNNWQTSSLTLPLLGKIITGERESILRGNKPLPTDASAYTEPWLVWDVAHVGPVGIIFNSADEISWETWHPLNLAWKIASIEPGQSMDLDPVTLHLKPSGWRDVQKLALNNIPSTLPLEPCSYGHAETSLFATSTQPEVRFNLIRNGETGGRAAVTYNNETIKTSTNSWNIENPMIIKSPEIQAENSGLVNLDYEFTRNYVTESGTLPVIIPEKNHSILIDTGREGDYEIFVVDNGVIQFNVSPEFSGVLYRLAENSDPGKNLLRTKFPDPAMWTWFNPWFGGLRYMFEFNYRFHESGFKGERVKISWNGFDWEGIKVIVSPKRRWRSLGIEFLYLTRPGCPVVLNLLRLTENSGCGRPVWFEQLGFPCPSGDPDKEVHAIMDEGGARVRVEKSEGGTDANNGRWAASYDPDTAATLGFVMNSGRLTVWDAADSGHAIWWTNRLDTIPGATVEIAQMVVLAKDPELIPALYNTFKYMGRATVGAVDEPALKFL